MHLLSVEEFLEWESLQDERYELVDGLVRAMAGGTADHNTIGLNLVASLRAATRSGGCRVFAEGMKIIAAGAVMYPDVVVTCAPVPPKADSVTEPVLIIEVLSRSTHEIDRGRKWLAYQQIASLRQYVLVSQDQARVEIFQRNSTPEQGWSYLVVTGLSATLTLEPSASALTLAEVYEDSSVIEGVSG
ncbi:MAG: Uma2 family endonuclease [Enhygromyxa sp.]